EGGEWLYFYAKKDSFIDQHVYRVRLDGSDLQKVSATPGWYEWNFSPDRTHVAETFSSARTPPVVTLRKPSGEAVRVLEAGPAKALEKYTVPNPEFIEVETSDGIVLNASMIKPSDFNPGKKYPVIGYGYGNAGSQVVMNRWGNGRGAERDLWHRYMAEQGFIIFSLDNRTTAGRGKEAKNLTYGHYAKYAVHDQLEGVEYLKSLPYVDASRLGFWGWSGGGYLACALMTKGAPHFKTAVSVAPVIDLSRYQAVGVERWMGMLDENPQGYREVNLLNYADKLEGDLLLIHGSGDENVKFAFTLQFADALIEHNKQFDMLVYPNRHHGIEDAQLHVFTSITN
ncbi:MAG: prolyl oligopeptidase family serine peptidase, partial [Woeseiaceae bacterium]